MVRYGRFRVTPTTEKGRVQYIVYAGSQPIKMFSSYGKAVTAARNYDKLEQQGKVFLGMAKRAGVASAQYAWNYLKTKPIKKRKKKSKRKGR